MHYYMIAIFNKIQITYRTWRINRKIDFGVPISIYLDDERFPKTKRNWLIVRNYKQFVNAFQHYGPIISYISFDNDLGYKQKEGYDCAKWLVSEGFMIDDFNVHSANPVAKENITCLLNNWKKFNTMPT